MALFNQAVGRLRRNRVCRVPRRRVAEKRLHATVAGTARRADASLPADLVAPDGHRVSGQLDRGIYQCGGHRRTGKPPEQHGQSGNRNSAFVRAYDFRVWSNRQDLEPPAGRDPQDGPPVRLRLPDGQQLVVTLVRRRRDPTGEWWAEIVVSLWGRLDLPTGHAGVEPAPVDLLVPMALLEPVAGQDYTRVPTEDLTVPRPWVIVWADPPVEEGDGGVLHRRDCSRARVRTAEPLDDAEAKREILTRWGRPSMRIGYCDLCRPQTSPEMRRLVRRAAGPAGQQPGPQK